MESGPPNGFFVSPPTSQLLRRRDLLLCLLLGIVSFAVYNANLRAIPAVDTYAARYLPLSIWHNHTVSLDPIVSAVAQGRIVNWSRGQADAAFWIRKGTDGHLVSLYPVTVPAIVAPLYLPAVAYLDAHGWDPLLVDSVARVMEKLCASLIATASVMLLYLALRRRADETTAGLLTAVYAFGTTTWAVSSQALWMHGPASLMIVATLLLLTGRVTAARIAAAGFCCALIVCIRPPDAVLAAALALFAIAWARHRIWLFVCAGAIPAGLLLAYNVTLVGNFFGAYAGISHNGLDSFLNDNPVEGLAGLLVSPTRGLFVFSPFLVFVPLFARPILRDRAWPLLTALLGLAVVFQIVGYAFGDWRQGASWGPRWLTDMLPILIWMLPPALGAMSRRVRVLFGATCVAAIAIQVIGAFWYIGLSEAAIFAPTSRADQMKAAWDIRNTPFLVELQHRPAAPDLFVTVNGNIDIIGPAAGADDGKLEAAGWALTDHLTPAGLMVRVDGALVGATTEFFDRPDVVKTLGEASPSGWRITFPADAIGPGDHIVAVLVKASAGGDARLLLERRFTIAAEDRNQVLAKAMRLAAGAIRARQQQPGYWLTTFTGDTSYTAPRPEMNTYTNAAMVDIAGPVAAKAGLSAEIDRAKAFLTSQIEPGGLVRYHGLPDAPTIGTLGCAITPDSDDTALVWRIAPATDRTLLATARSTLDRFRTADGLYRTWLAAPDEYQCLDPGRDPNPADFGIQMHIFMLLAKLDPAAAHRLCMALDQKLDDDGVWVYYRNAPPIILLRLAELDKAGCHLRPLAARLQTHVDGQQPWLDLIVSLEALESGGPSKVSLDVVADQLRAIAADDFSRIAKNPPLIYHNDLSATVRRYYWSEELGFALWLRLYFAYERALSMQPCPPDVVGQSCGQPN